MNKITNIEDCKSKSEKVRKVERLNQYIPALTGTFYGGFIYDGRDIDLCDDSSIDKSSEIKVTQKIKNNIVYTDKYTKIELSNGRLTEEKTHLEFTVRKGDLLVYVIGMGFVIPETKMQTLSETKKFIDLMEVKDDSKGNEK